MYMPDNLQLKSITISASSTVNDHSNTTSASLLRRYVFPTASINVLSSTNEDDSQCIIWARKDKRRKIGKTWHTSVQPPRNGLRRWFCTSISYLQQASGLFSVVMYIPGNWKGASFIKPKSLWVSPLGSDRSCHVVKASSYADSDWTSAISPIYSWEYW